jgi:hypothetical protein
VTRNRSESERRSTAELDPISLEGLLDVEERVPKPTTVMRRDDLLELVNASTAASVSTNAVPRVLLEQRQRTASEQREPLDASGSGVSPLIVLAIIGVLIGMFAAIVLTN